MKKIVLTLVILVLILFVWVFFIEPNCLTVRVYNIKNEKLKGVKTVFASDFHLRTYQEKRLIRIINLINKQNPDIVFLGGDYVNGHKTKTSLPVSLITKHLGSIQTKYGIYAILGNHDWWQDGPLTEQELKKNDITVLANNNTSVKINENNIYIAGVEDLLTRKADINQALLGTNSPVILLTHWPDIFDKVPQNVDLVLAGHTHGGQIILPFWGALVIPHIEKHNYSWGLFKNENVSLIVTKGLGTSILPIRFNCMPEIVVINFT